MAALGIDAAAFEPAEGDGETDDAYPVWPDNAEAVALFLACQTQWRLAAVAGAERAALVWHGLDYAGAAAAARATGRRLRGELFEDLRVMEAAAMAELNRS